MFFQDLRYAFRTLRRTPGVSAIAIVSLALGIAGNTVVFSIVNAFILVPPPYEDPDSVVVLFETRRQTRDDLDFVAPATFVDWQERSRSFERLVGFESRSVTLTGVSEPEQVNASAVSGDMFALLGRQPERGRGFGPEEDQPDGARVAVVSHGFWQRRLASDPSILGRVLELDGLPHEVVGVMPFELEYPSAEVDLWIPAQLDRVGASREKRSLVVVGRLKNSVSVEQARGELATIGDQLEAEFPSSSRGYRAFLIPSRDLFPGPRDRTLIISLMGAVLAVLLIACANVANLLLAKAQGRSREVAVRVALGASRGRLIRQLLTESLLLSALGGALGLLLAGWGLDLAAAGLPRELPRLYDLRLNLNVLAFTAIATVLAGVVFGLAPALQTSRVEQDALKSGGRGGTPARRARRLRSALVVGEVAVALVALTATGLLIRSVTRLQTVDPGFDADDVLTLRVSLPEPKYPDLTQVRSFYATLLERARAIPGVERVAAVSALPRARSNPVAPVAVDEATKANPGEAPTTAWLTVSPDYFETLAVPIVRGRTFSDADREDRPPVAIVNQAMAERFWPNRDPIGERVWLLDEWREVVAVSANVMQDRIQFEPEPRTIVYLPMRQSPSHAMSLMLKLDIDPAAAASAARRVVSAIDPDQPISDIMTMPAFVRQQFAGARVVAGLFGVFDLFALLLAGLGIYGLMAQSVTERTQEIGIRMALGAQARDVLWSTIREGATLTTVGAALGFTGAVLVSRGLTALLFGIDPMDRLTFGSVAALLVAVAACASYVPARRATHVDPMVALRTE